MSKIFAVIGKPVLHSMSPQMFNAAFEYLNIDARYIRLAAESKEEAIKLAKEMGISGMNVTAPFKDIISNMDEVGPLSQKIGAVNTVIFRNGKASGYNTDAYGVTHSFLSKKIKLKNQKAVVIGAGGAARAAIVGLLAEGARVVVANRTLKKAESLAEEFAVECCSLDDIAGHLSNCRIVVACLSTPERVVPKDFLRKDMAILDAYYASETALVKDARDAGCTVMDGKEWLVYQGKMSLELFTEKTVPEYVLRKAIGQKHDKRNIALIGPMGSGKDAVAASMKTGTFDIDKEIEKKSGPIARIFQEKGEKAFRDLESKELRKISGKTNAVINCGGGAVLSKANRELLREHAVVVWLWANAKTLSKRIPKDGSRPLLNVDDPEKRIRELLDERMQYYADASDLVVNTNGKKPEDVAKRISYEIDNALPNLRGS